MKRWCTSTGSGAPPEPQNFSARRSNCSTPGKWLIAVYIVGTPGNTVTFLAARSFRMGSGDQKRTCRICVAPSRTPNSMLTDSA